MSEHSKKMPDIRKPIIEVGVRRPRFCTLLKSQNMFFTLRHFKSLKMFLLVLFKIL